MASMTLCVFNVLINDLLAKVRPVFLVSAEQRCLHTSIVASAAAASASRRRCTFAR